MKWEDFLVGVFFKLNNLIIVELTHDVFTYYNIQYDIGGYTNEIYNKKINTYIKIK